MGEKWFGIICDIKSKAICFHNKYDHNIAITHKRYLEILKTKWGKNCSKKSKQNKLGLESAPSTDYKLHDAVEFLACVFPYSPTIHQYSII